MNKKPITIKKIADYELHLFSRLYLLILLVFGMASASFSAQSETPAAGFIFDHFKLTLEDGYRTEAAGPFYYSQQTETEKIWAIPPFFSCDRNPAVESHEDDFLYPLLTHIRYGHEHRWQFGQLISTASGQNQNEADVKRFTLFPLYFQQRAPDTNLNYTAVFPFYGRLKNRLFHDEIYFIMFPVFGETRKRDLVTDNYFYPFVHVRHGDGLDGWQVWPFVGREHKDVTTQTNGFGDATRIGGHDHSFYCLAVLSETGQRHRARTILKNSAPRFRFSPCSRSPQCDSTTVLWPFFTAIDDRAKKYREWQGPWPFVIFARGEGKHTSRVWPLVQRIAQ